MYYYQKWSKHSFEYNYLKCIKEKIKENPNINCYIGFDFGFFRGVNIYYNKENKYANTIYDNFIKNKINVRLFTNIDYDFDIIILLGYTNIPQEKRYLRKNKKIIMKALSFF
jgi:hypothetical protein